MSNGGRFYSVGYGGSVAVRPLAWRVRNFNCWHITDGRRAEAPALPKTTGYPAVEDVPPRPQKPAMTADELSKLKKELTAARDHQAPKGQAGAGVGQPIKP